MKKSTILLFIIVVFCFSESLLAQSMRVSGGLIFNFQKKTFSNATVHLNDGTHMLGEVRDFESPNTVEVEHLGGSLESIEKSLNFNNKKISFRKNESDEVIKIPAENIDAITFFDEKLNMEKEFKRLNIYKTNAEGVKEEIDRIIFAPLLKHDVISTYGFTLFNKDINSKDVQYMTTLFYFANGDSNDAMSPYDFTIFEVLKKDFFKNKMINSFQFASNNCEDFINWLEEKFDEVYDKDKFKKERKAFEKDIKEGKKAYKTRLEKRVL